MHKSLATIVFTAVLSLSTVSGQQSSNTDKLVLPDSVMRQVVSRILIWHSKPSRQSKTIPVSEHGVKREWLPSIRNVKFQLASDNDALKSERGVFLFEGLERIGRHYSINVGWGDSDCDGSGESWAFNVANADKIRLWRLNEGWGRGCGGNGPPNLRGLKMGESSPNEIRGYEFFRKGKLNPIRIGISTKDDVRRIFNDACETECDYDENWQLWADYYEDGIAFTQTTGDSKDAEVKTEFFPRPEFIGKLQTLRLTPRKPISFLRVIFPKTFAKNERYSIGDDWDENGFAGAVHSTTNTYTDGYGLEYSVYDKETFNNRRSKEREQKNAVHSGDLIGIEYRMPDSLNDVIYIGQVKGAIKK